MKPSLKAIIVDDEPAARRLLHYLCNYNKNIEVIGEAANGTVAIELINKLEPDVVFLDIQLPDITGLEVLQKLSFRPNIIFTTAYEQFALQAFETFAVDYLLKPIKEERFEAALHKLEAFGKLKQETDFIALQKLLAELKPKPEPKALPVKTGDKIIFLDFDIIGFFQANDKYVNIFTTDGKKYLIDLTLNQLEAKLPGTFIRIQKSYIINKTLIKEVHKHFNSRFVIILNDKNCSRITSGLTFYDSIKSSMGL